jgi:hypothetical protein
VSSTPSLEITALGKEFGSALQAKSPNEPSGEVSPVIVDSTPSKGNPIVEVQARESEVDLSDRIPRKGPTLKIRDRQAVALELKKLRQERRSTKTDEKVFQCRLCKVNCNSLIAFREHVQSRRHQHAKSLKLGHPKCGHCNREFESEAYYERHLRGKNHLKVVSDSTLA